MVNLEFIVGLIMSVSLSTTDTTVTHIIVLELDDTEMNLNILNFAFFYYHFVWVTKDRWSLKKSSKSLITTGVEVKRMAI